ncbi:MAG: DoxX family protein [Betaproteobacteria bacterium]|nr:DoxX family protein [Betaproteobacteria bacterium]
MTPSSASPLRNEILAAARFLIALLFLIFGWEKFMNFSGTLQYMEQVGAPLPDLATLVAIVMELFVGIAIVLGLYTRPLALLLALYTFGTAVIGHHYWTMTGMARFEGEINFYKNISIIGGLLALYVSGPGQYSIDAMREAARSKTRQ